jgi:uncharacterized membrane protein YtjA (UPF0391 family)
MAFGIHSVQWRPGQAHASQEAVILYRTIVPLILLVIAAIAVVSGVVHLTVGALKLVFGALILLFLVSMVTGRRRRR